MAIEISGKRFVATVALLVAFYALGALATGNPGWLDHMVRLLLDHG
jgi:hypothetical protein